MTTSTMSTLASPATKVVLRCVVYYAVLLGLGALLWNRLPRAGVPSLSSFVEAFGGAQGGGVAGGTNAAPLAGDPSLTVMVIVAMSAAILLSIPVAWVYLLTRAKRGYQQSVVQLLIILPLVVSGIVVLVKYSLALAFSLAGIVAAVRFRNNLDDSKDAVYVFLATGIGLAAAVEIPVAAAISIVFNITMLVLWYSDFGNAPAELEGDIAQRRLQRAKRLARTGTFVAQIDKEVLRNMNRDQLEGIAQRAWRRAHEQSPDGEPETDGKIRLKVQTQDVERTRAALDTPLTENSKEWRFDRITISPEGARTIHYIVRLKKKGEPEELLALVRAAGAPELIGAELE